MRIDSNTRLLGLIGKPARHSLSPVMHNAAFSELGLNFVYLVFEPSDLRTCVFGLKELGVVGFNVTMPFKSQVIGLLDEVDEVAKKIGSVNAVVNQNGFLKGFNTDGLGALNAISRVVSVSGKRVLVIGAGGAGRAISFYLSEAGAKVFVCNRSVEKARDLAMLVGGDFLGFDALEDRGLVESFDVIVNASSCGMNPNFDCSPLNPSFLSEEQVVFDIVYDPIETVLLRGAKEKGAKTISGVDMLLEQGFESFRLFTGKNAPKKVMEKAVLGALRGI